MDKMLTLSIETSGMTGGIGIVSSGAILGEIIISSHKTYSNRLISSILWLFKELEISWQEIELIGISLGPGSFTGLRIGVSTAKGFCLAHKIPLFGVPTLDVLARNALFEKSKIICPIIDARRKQIYTALYQPKNGNEFDRITDYFAIYPDTLFSLIPKDKDVLFLGSGLSIYQKQIKDLFGRRAFFAPKFMWDPRPAYTGIIAEKKILMGQKPSDPSELVPLYCRLSEAEENRLRYEKTYSDKLGPKG